MSDGAYYTPSQMEVTASEGSLPTLAMLCLQHLKQGDQGLPWWRPFATKAFFFAGPSSFPTSLVLLMRRPKACMPSGASKATSKQQTSRRVSQLVLTHPVLVDVPDTDFDLCSCSLPSFRCRKERDVVETMYRPVHEYVISVQDGKPDLKETGQWARAAESVLSYGATS